jgi:hypothetical protein
LAAENGGKKNCRNLLIVREKNCRNKLPVRKIAENNWLGSKIDAN